MKTGLAGSLMVRICSQRNLNLAKSSIKDGSASTTGGGSSSKNAFSVVEVRRDPHFKKTQSR